MSTGSVVAVNCCVAVSSRATPLKLTVAPPTMKSKVPLESALLTSQVV